MRTLGYTVVVVCFLGILEYSGQNSANPSNEDRAQTPALSPEERYQDMFPLTKDNFTQSVLRSGDPWIVLFHDGSVHREWKTMAIHLRGLCWVGLVHIAQETDLIQVLEYDSSEGPARLYPYGDRKTKERNWRKISNPNEARTAAIASLPDRTVRISGDSVHDLLLDCFTSRPSRFPAVLVTDEDETPSAFKAIAKRFEKYFAFGKIVKPSTKDLQKLGLDELFMNPPELFVIVTQNGKADKIDAIRFDKDRIGSTNYTAMMEFLFAINGQFRHDLPGDNMAAHKEVMEMSDIIEIERKRFEIVRDKKKAEEENKENIKTDASDFKIKITTHVGMKDEL